MRLRTFEGFDLKLLIDTGANKNYLSPRLVNRTEQLPIPAFISNITGKHVINNYVNFNPFPGISKSSFIFHVFEFHKFFDGLIGYETLQQIGALIDAKNSILNISGFLFKLYKKYPEILSIEIPAQSNCTIEVPTTAENGDFFVEYDYEILPNLFICAGIYHAHQYKAFIQIENRSSASQYFTLDFPLKVELNNFQQVEINNNNVTTISNRYRKLIDQLRLDHLNFEERTKLLDVIAEHQLAFYVEGESLSNTTEVKHLIYTKDDLPIYQKSYRYPHCHRKLAIKFRKC